jgi:hypothetical protein
MITFVPFTEVYYRQSYRAPQSTVRIFIGQLPSHITDEQIYWMCAALGGVHVYNIERIVDHHNHRSKGCVHAFCDPQDVNNLVDLLHKRVLIDDTGFWFARSLFETEFLNDYVWGMKNGYQPTFLGRPSNTVVVDIASSKTHSSHAPMMQPTIKATRYGSFDPASYGTASGFCHCSECVPAPYCSMRPATP